MENKDKVIEEKDGEKLEPCGSDGHHEDMHGNHEDRHGHHECECCCADSDGHHEGMHSHHEDRHGHHEGECCCAESDGHHEDMHGHHEDRHSHHGPEISCGCGHCHSNDSDEDGHHHEHQEEMPLRKIIIALVLFVMGLCVEHIPFFAGYLGDLSMYGQIPVHKGIYLVLYMISYIIIGKDVIKSAVYNMLHGEFFDEQFLMSVASIGAIFVGEIGEAVAVLLFYNVGEFFQDYAVDKSRDSISALMDIRPDRAFVIRDGKTVQTVPEDVKIGETIQVKPGERVPLDGTIISGSTFMDTSALTGESVPRAAGEGSEVMAGFVNTQGVVNVKVTKLYGESAVSRILELTENSSAVKAKSEKFITRFAKVYTPVVCILAVLVASVPPLYTQYFMPEIFAEMGWHDWIYRALMFLVVSCPCALVISVPLSFFGGIGAASKHGILVKGSNFVEALSKIETAVFDKTGTLTKGIFAVSRVYAEDGINEDELVALASHAEYFSNHPISKSLQAAHLLRCQDNSCCEKAVRSEGEEISGHGIKIILEGKTVLAGNEKLMRKEGVKKADGSDYSVPEKLNADKTPGTVIYVAEDGIYKGCIVISDDIKEDSLEAIRNLKKIGVKKTVMLTGDNESTATLIAENLGIDEVYAGLLPEDKVSRVETLLKKNGAQRKGSLVFVGDGVNDSPVLARADVGVAMGGLGSDAAIEAADVVIMDDKPSRLVKAVKISRATMTIVRQNIWLSLGVKAGIMILGTLGIANMWIAVFGDVGVCFIAILNSMRILRK